jgi:hypothetical protein
MKTANPTLCLKTPALGNTREEAMEDRQNADLKPK